MRQETREWIIDRVECAFIWAGASDFDAGVNTFKNFVDKLQSTHDTMRSKDHFAHVLDDLPEPTWLEKRFIQGFFRYLPQLLRYGAKQFAQATEAMIPELPRGRPGLDAYSKAQIVGEIGKKVLRGCTQQQAKVRTARQFNVSLATVQRAWDDRGNRGEVDFRSVLKYLSEDGKLLNAPSTLLGEEQSG